MTGKALAPGTRSRHRSRLGPTGDGLRPLANLKRLERLDLNGVYGEGLKDRDLKGLGSLRGLRSLNLTNNPDLSDATLAAIGALEKLETLNLHKAKVTDARLGHLAKLKRLKVLELAGTGVTEAGLKAIVAFASDNQQTVRLPASVSKAALAQARKQRPKVSFSY